MQRWMGQFITNRCAMINSIAASAGPGDPKWLELQQQLPAIEGVCQILMQYEAPYKGLGYTSNFEEVNRELSALHEHCKQVVAMAATQSRKRRVEGGEPEYKRQRQLDSLLE